MMHVAPLNYPKRGLRRYPGSFFSCSVAEVDKSNSQPCSTFIFSISPTLNSPYISLCFLLEQHSSCIQPIFYVSCCVLPSVVALLVLVCFKAISHIVMGSPRVMTECILGLFTPWCSELICSSLCLSLFLSPLSFQTSSSLHSSVVLFGCLIILLVLCIVSS